MDRNKMLEYGICLRNWDLKYDRFPSFETISKWVKDVIGEDTSHQKEVEDYFFQCMNERGKSYWGVSAF